MSPSASTTSSPRRARTETLGIAFPSTTTWKKSSLPSSDASPAAMRVPRTVATMPEPCQPNWTASGSKASSITRPTQRTWASGVAVTGAAALPAAARWAQAGASASNARAAHAAARYRRRGRLASMVSSRGEKGASYRSGGRRVLAFRSATDCPQVAADAKVAAENPRDRS